MSERGQRMSAQVWLHERTVIAPGTDAPYRYSGLGDVRSDIVPTIGDLVSHGPGMYRVVDRHFRWPDPGSYNAIHGDVGPWVDLVVVKADGPFADEAELTDAERDEDAS